MRENKDCLVCDTEAEVGGVNGAKLWNCPRCGKFEVTDSAEPMVNEKKDRLRKIFSGWVREQNDIRIIPRIWSQDIERLVLLPIPSAIKRSYLLLRTIARETEMRRLGARVVLQRDEELGRTYSQDDREVNFLRDYLREQGWLEVSSKDKGSRITVEGFRKLDEFFTQTKAIAQCFVAMSFGDELMPAYDLGIAPALEAAGYEPFRMDGMEHIDKIDDRIIAEIRRSAFLVADFTGHKGGVYFEAGFAMGLGLPVVWTCQKNDLDNLHFDIRQYNCIDWTTHEELKSRLKNRVEAVIGVGPKI